MTIGIGFIGAGAIGRVHMHAARGLGWNLVGLCDANEAAARDAGAAFGVARVHADVEGLRADARVEAVVIATPNHLHRAQAIACLRAGRHVLLEKPLALDAAEGEDILRARDASGCVVQLGMANRHKQGPQAARAAIQEGACGTILGAQVSWLRRRGIPGFGGWATTRALAGGGALIDIGVHMLDLALWLMDFPEPTAASGTTYNTWPELAGYTYTSMWGAPVPNGVKDVEDAAFAHIRLVGGGMIQLAVSWALNADAAPHEQHIRILGDRGGVELRGLDQAWILGERAGRLSDTRLSVPASDEFPLQLRRFARAIARAEPPAATLEEALVVQRALDAIYRSAASGQEERIRAEAALAR